MPVTFDPFSSIYCCCFLASLLWLAPASHTRPTLLESWPPWEPITALHFHKSYEHPPPMFTHTHIHTRWSVLALGCCCLTESLSPLPRREKYFLCVHLRLCVSYWCASGCGFEIVCMHLCFWMLLFTCVCLRVYFYVYFCSYCCLFVHICVCLFLNLCVHVCFLWLCV